jgi:hypothetical protein
MGMSCINFMRLLLRSLLTKEFLSESGDWRSDCAQAYDFKTLARATKFCDNHEIKDAELVAEFMSSKTIFPYFQAQEGESIMDD